MRSQEVTVFCVLCFLLVCGMETPQSSLELYWGQEHILCPGRTCAPFVHSQQFHTVCTPDGPSPWVALTTPDTSWLRQLSLVPGEQILVHGLVGKMRSVQNPH